MTTNNYIPVRINGRLLFKYDPIRKLIQIKARQETHLVDLAAVEAEAAQEPGPMTRDEALAVIRRLVPGAAEEQGRAFDETIRRVASVPKRKD
jgi:hypothetical protein